VISQIRDSAVPNLDDILKRAAGLFYSREAPERHAINVFVRRDVPAVASFSSGFLGDFSWNINFFFVPVDVFPAQPHRCRYPAPIHRFLDTRTIA
jgi:hypothetical protein